MCGISGAIGIFGPRVVAGLERMHTALAHRGPDAEGSWILDGPPAAPRVALKHRRLSILDLSAAGRQPMVDPATKNRIVFNGEIYNHGELRFELEGHGRRFASRSDTEVLLAAYAAWGAGCVDRLRGMFAFALYDPARREVLLARDRLGKKPLYVAEFADGEGRFLLFASELRALLESGLLERRLDPAGLATYLWNGFVRGPGTIARGVRLLPPGTTATVRLDEPRLEPRRYWSLPRAAEVRSDPYELRAELARAVKLRLESDVPLGVFLSGGVDSSAVASLAVRAGGREVRTFNVAFDEPGFDESSHARAVAQRLGTRHDELRLDSAMFRANLPAALDSLDQPTFDGLNTYFVSRAVREAGIKVALAGTGGDELFGGYRSFVDLPRARAWSRRLSSVPQALLRRAADALARVKLGRFGEVPPQTRWGKLADVLGARGSPLALYQISYALYTRDFLRELAPRVEQALRCNGAVLDGVPAEVHAELSRESEAEPTLHGISRLEMGSFLGERLLRDTDATSMSVALEVRAPFVDHRVIELAAGLDESTRFRPLLRKQFLRSAALEDLSAGDPALFERKKSGFVLPLERWCREGLSGEVGSALCDAARWQELGLEPGPVARLWRAFRAGAPGVYWSRVWSLYVLSWWCRRHRLSLA